MNSFNRQRQKTRRLSKPELESLGERIAPAGFHPGLVGAEHLAALWFNAESRFFRHNLAIREGQPVGGNGPIGKPHKPIIASGPVQGPMLNLMVANAGSTNGKSPIHITKPVNQPFTLAAPKPFFGRPTIVLPVSGPTNPPTDTATNPPPGTVGTLPGNVANALVAIYNEFEQNPSAFSPPTTGPGSVVVDGDHVGIQVHDSNPAEFQTLLTELTNDGMNVTISSAAYGTIVGMLPISELLSASQLSQTISITSELTPSRA